MANPRNQETRAPSDPVHPGRPRCVQSRVEEGDVSGGEIEDTPQKGERGQNYSLLKEAVITALDNKKADEHST